MMAISTRGRYSLRILTMMASEPQGRTFTKHEIAEAEGISGAYVQQLMIALRAAGFVSSHRGKVGGFTLSRSADKITVAEALSATEGHVVLAPCLANESCEREQDCPTRPLWRGATKLLDDFFSAVTIAQLVEGGPNSYPWVAEGI
jgi:Rrf2 family iron-sulfur cluster assembly transcriptional regulator